MDKRSFISLTVVIGLLALAGYFALQFFNQDSGVSEKAFFYDLSEQKLFVADRGMIPPIKGINDAAEDGVRAVVIAPSGDPKNKASRTIAYLEKYSPELKRDMEAARASNGSPVMGRSGAQEHRFVKRLNDKEWFSLTSEEGQQIVTEWATPGPSGVSPAVCTP